VIGQLGRKIFGYKEFTRRIFRNKDLAPVVELESLSVLGIEGDLVSVTCMGRQDPAGLFEHGSSLAF
jgi:hypothetical protein